MGSLHCIDVGWGDCTVIRTETATFLVDCHRIVDHSQLLLKDKTIQAVFITHQHKDHFSGLSFLKDEGYAIKSLIYSPYDRRYADSSVTVEEWTDFDSLKNYFGSKGTNLYAPHRQENFDKAWWDLGNGIRFWMIGPNRTIANTDRREIHDASLVIMAFLGGRRCLFAGDASDANLQDIAGSTNNYCNDILHASHHGSLNGACLDFIKKCNAKMTVVSTKTGVYEGAPDPTALKRYKDNTEQKVYRTDVDGSLKWDF